MVLAVKPAFYLRHLLPKRPTRAQQVAFVRAAHALEAQERLTLTHWLFGARDQGHLMVARPGVDALAARRERDTHLTNREMWREILSVAEVAR